MKQGDTQRLRSAIRALVRRFSISERADVACCGMTVAQAAALEALGDSDALRPGDLGRRLGISPSTTSRNLARLTERGLVARTADPADGRAARVRLTRSGREAAASVEEYEREFARTILDELPARSRRAVLDGLDELLAAVRRATEACCPGAFDHLMETTCCERDE